MSKFSFFAADLSQFCVQGFQKPFIHSSINRMLVAACKWTEQLPVATSNDIIFNSVLVFAAQEMFSTADYVIYFLLLKSVDLFPAPSLSFTVSLDKSRTDSRLMRLILWPGAGDRAGWQEK